MRFVDVDSETYMARANGVIASCAALQSTNVDWQFPEDRRYIGLQIILQNHSSGDTATISVIDKDNVLGFGANTIIDTQGLDLPVITDRQDQGVFTASAPKLVPSGLYLRVRYTNTGLVSVSFRMRIFTHKRS